MISQTLVAEFQQAIQNEYGRDISLKDSAEILTDLISYYDLLAKIHHKGLVEKEMIK